MNQTGLIRHKDWLGRLDYLKVSLQKPRGKMIGRIVGTVMLVGAGVLTVAAIVAAPRVIRVARPALREGLKRGMQLYVQARGAAAEAAEDMEDLFAEVREEIGRTAVKAARAAAESTDRT